MMKAQIHPNAHMIKAGENLCISLKEIRKNSRTRLTATVILSDVEFVVHDSGRKRAVKENTKNVHAWARGTLMGDYDKKIELCDFEVPDSIKKRFREFSYNYEVGHFFDVETNKPLTTARTVYAVGDKFYYLPAK